jgi:hypothetical protein
MLECVFENGGDRFKCSVNAGSLSTKIMVAGRLALLWETPDEWHDDGPNFFYVVLSPGYSMPKSIVRLNQIIHDRREGDTEKFSEFLKTVEVKLEEVNGNAYEVTVVSA